MVGGGGEKETEEEGVDVQKEGRWIEKKGIKGVCGGQIFAFRRLSEEETVMGKGSGNLCMKRQT